VRAELFTYDPDAVGSILAGGREGKTEILAEKQLSRGGGREEFVSAERTSGEAALPCWRRK
jgi:hypothetical protein